MNVNISGSERRQDPDVKTGVARRVVQILILVAFQAAMLFLSSGQLGWSWAWVFIGLYLAGISVNGSLMMRYNPETIAERARAGDNVKGWDKIVGGLFGVMYFVVMLLVAGLDVRSGWSRPVALALHIAAAVAFVLGFALLIWSMVSNAYFATVVRIQKERGHTVCNAGPYRFVRHPGYVGAIIQSFAVPLLLGSLWALIPGGLAALLMVARTALEDQTLREELKGYIEYAQQTRYRLLPGVW